MSDDAQMLRQYADHGSESAFTELVQQHLNLVYSAALRETNGDTAAAEDIAQAVFTELARKAPRLLSHPCLAGWLYTAVRHVSANWRRGEQHRRHREEEAYAMNELLAPDALHGTWQQIRPVLDDALHELREADRAVLVLRFLEDRPLREVGAKLGVNENTARMRADRALDKLRALLVRRGITATTSGLAAALAAGVITPAPAALASTITGAALAGAAAGTTTLTAMKILSMSTLKVGVIGALVVAGTALPLWQQRRLAYLRSENDRLRAQTVERATLRGASEAPARPDPDQAELERLRQWQAQTQPELLRLRSMAAAARVASAEAERLRAQLAQRTAEADTNAVGGPMAAAMKQAVELQMDAHLSRMAASLRLTPEQVQSVRAILQRQGRMMSVGMQQAFSGKFDQEELARLAKDGGNPDAQIQALLTPEQQAAFPAYQQEEAAHNAGLAANTDLLQMQATLGLNAEQLDRAYAALYELNLSQITGRVTPPPSSSPADAMQWTLDQKAGALASVLTPPQLESYRQQLAIQSNLMRDTSRRMTGTRSRE